MKKQNIILAILLISLSSCARSCQSLQRGLQNSERNYHVKVYSGPRLIRDDKFRGILNQEEHSDGVFYFKDDTLIELSGSYEITSTK